MTPPHYRCKANPRARGDVRRPSVKDGWYRIDVRDYYRRGERFRDRLPKKEWKNE
ncbi:MAG: hypothetical protein HRF40_00400 [Nitrososphaera sp.]